ncbi:hypothetical protein LTR50_006644 [Elasticomyces elasticus]|nr:hypothetical protein LTR50_006644 [Elasticomyces elasticus]
MGICASCLGLGRHPSQDPSEQPLLYDDPSRPRYGTSQPPTVPQVDPEVLRREREMLESICAQTSDKLIDVTHTTTTHTDPTTTTTTPSKLPTEYPRLFNSRFPPLHHPPHSGASTPSRNEDRDDDDEEAWLNEAAAAADGGALLENVKGLHPGALVLNLGDVAGEAAGGGKKALGKARAR